MSTIDVFKAKNHFSSLLKRIEQGERVVITKHGRPVARLIPVNDQDMVSKREAIEQLKKFNASHTLGALDWKALRDEGRK